MIKLTPFQPDDFSRLIAWIDSEELLITIAGTYFTYPLTEPQLQNYLNDATSIAFNIVDIVQNKTIGHAEIILTGKDTCKLDKVIVGEKYNRGKGIGGMIIHELLQYSFGELQAREVELNVYDWNIAGIKCYEKAGFTVNPQKIQQTQVKGATWIAKNMTIDKDRWIKTGATGNQGLRL